MGRRGRWTGLVLALAVALGAALAARAGTGAEQPGRVPKPAVVIEKGERCVEDVEFMRRNHMELLKHRRWDAVQHGVRSRRVTLQGCIDCHASHETGSVLGEGNFCQSCHSYAAVSLDCFECHASKPKAQGIAGREGAK